MSGSSKDILKNQSGLPWKSWKAKLEGLLIFLWEGWLSCGKNSEFQKKLWAIDPKDFEMTYYFFDWMLCAENYMQGRNYIIHSLCSLIHLILSHLIFSLHCWPHFSNKLSRFRERTYLAWHQVPELKLDHRSPWSKYKAYNHCDVDLYVGKCKSQIMKDNFEKCWENIRSLFHPMSTLKFTLLFKFLSICMFFFISIAISKSWTWYLKQAFLLYKYYISMYLNLRTQ